MNNKFFIVIFFWIIVSLLLDFYIFFSLKQVIGQSTTTKKLLYVYGTLAVINILILCSGFVSNIMLWNPYWRTITIMGFLLFLLFKLLFACFLCIDDIVRVFTWVSQYFSKANETVASPFSLSRKKFIVWLGLGISALPSLTLIYGAIFNPYNYKFRRLKIQFPNLPESFHGFTVVQLSDIHSGSFYQTKPIEDVIKKINAESPDLLVFTGDLVNNTAKEIEPYISIFGQLKAKHGVYSSLGNHDYGDYWQWENKEAKIQNLNDLKKAHADMGWRLLLNENIKIEKGQDFISLIGVENVSSHRRFRSQGDLTLASNGTKESPFTMLLSHDPSHWDSEVNTNFTHIDLTLSGHTHGFQFGIEIPGFKWSPSQWAYKQWAGLYKKGEQYLYVNRGFGFLGYPGRVGILPEVTVITLEKA